MAASVRSLVMLVMIAGGAAEADTAPPQRCAGPYAEDLSALSPAARELEVKTPAYSYAVRTTATYECLAYGTDANVRKSRRSALAYGTAFGYRLDGGDTLLLTNEHVAAWPAVTDDEHPVDGIPAGCKRVADSLAIVDNDHDDYASDDIPLARVVTDPQLDVAVLRAKTKLQVMPWKVGKSADLRTRTAVEAKGFPLGAFRATNVGKVISAHDHDEFRDWNHDDFVIDALLSHGNSGSPVLAVSCATGEFELVGIFHANYAAGSALNVVIAIDQVRDMMATLKRSPPAAAGLVSVDAAARVRVLDVARGTDDPPYFQAGPLVAKVHARKDGSLVFTVFSAEFPRASRPLLVVEDLPPASGDTSVWGRLGEVYVGTKSGLVRFAVPETGKTAMAQLLEVLRRDAIAAFDLRTAAATANNSYDEFQRHQRSQRELDRELALQKDLPQQLAELAGRAPDKDRATLAQIEADPPVAVVVPAVSAAPAAARATGPITRP